MNGISRRNMLAGCGAAAGLATGVALVPSLAAAATTRATTIRPGEIWRDTGGKPIQAHGGSIIAVDGLFYWYGENKEFTTATSAIHSWGVRGYRSSDLVNWEDLGTIVKPDEANPNSPLHPAKYLDRPHILHNKRTGQFVCWIKMLSDDMQTRAVLVADKITGPYRLLRQDLLPVGMSAGDFDLVTSPDDGKAYMYFERVHSEMICADLTADYTDFTGYYSTHFPQPGPPFTREAPAYFRRGGKHYLITSGTTGYFPNPSRVAVADSFHGPWTDLGDLHPGDPSRTSFNSQICSVFRHPGKKDLYIALADRWMGPQSGKAFENGDTSRLVERAFAKSFAKPPQPLTADEAYARNTLGGLGVDTSQSRYVWLPLSFDKDGRPGISWRPQWSPDDFA